MEKHLNLHIREIREWTTAAVYRSTDVLCQEITAARVLDPAHCRYLTDGVEWALQHLQDAPRPYTIEMEAIQRGLLALRTYGYVLELAAARNKRTPAVIAENERQCIHAERAYWAYRHDRLDLLSPETELPNIPLKYTKLERSL